MSQLSDVQKDLLFRAAASPDGIVEAPAANVYKPLIRAGQLIAITGGKSELRLILTAAARPQVKQFKNPVMQPENCSTPPATNVFWWLASICDLMALAGEGRRES